jgi:hypothetical protein
MNYSDLWPLVQHDLLGCLQADAFLGTRTGLALEPGDVADTLARKIQSAVGPGLDGKSGVGFLVLPIEEAGDPNPNLPGGPLQLGLRVRFVENVTLNRGPRGTQIPCRVWTAVAEKVLKLYTPVGLTQSLVPANPVIHEFTPDDEASLRVGQLAFVAAEADFTPFQRLNRPLLTVTGAAGPPANPNAFLLTGPAIVAVSAPGADAIYFTTDGSHPWAGNAAAQPYSVPVAIAQPCLFRARAFARAKTGSDTAALNFYA